MMLGLTDRKGFVEPLKLPPGLYSSPRVSPDGTRIAFEIDDGKEATIYTYELAGRSGMQRVTFGGNNRFPIWSRMVRASHFSPIATAISRSSGSPPSAAPPNA